MDYKYRLPGGQAYRHPRLEVDWEGHRDGENPRNWSVLYKGFVLISISWTTLMVVIAATAYTSGISEMVNEFHLDNHLSAELGLTFYLIGWLIGSVFLAPMSETYGRRPVYILSTTAFVLLISPCALSDSIAGIIVFRFFAAVAGAGVICLAPGTIGDIANDSQRPLAYSVWSIGPFTAPTIGPVVGGFVVESLGWRWITWIVMMGTGLGILMLLCVKESYAPLIIRQKLLRKRQETNDERWWCRFDSQDGLGQKLAVNLRRPFVLSLTEPMLLSWNLYIGLIYGLLYLSFASYPMVFGEIRGWSAEKVGLSFLGLGAGSLLCILSEPLIRRFIKKINSNTANGESSPEATVSVVCLAAILLPVGQFWFAWSLAPPVHWLVPIAAGVPFGFGATMNFIYSLSYLAHSYGQFAASVMVGNTAYRCLFGGLLPLAWEPMSDRLGPHWAGSLLGFLLTAMAPIPFIFYRYGAVIRRRSIVIATSRAEEERLLK